MDSPIDASRLALLDDIVRRVDAARAALPQATPPCFAHMRVAARGHTRDYLLGPRTVTDNAVTVLQWETSPLAAAFFACPEGSDYELPIGERAVTGTVLSRALLYFDGAVLRAVEQGGVTFTRDRDGRWHATADEGSAPLRARPDGRSRPPSTVEVTLDDTQRRAVEQRAGGAMLVLGEAGVGKTTVALRRLAHLKKLRGDAPWSAAVVVPTEGLRRLTEVLLERLGLTGVDVAIYDRWAARMAYRVFPDVPSRLSEDAMVGVLRVKRHRALAPVLRAFAAERYAARGARVRRDDLHHLFGDRVWMERVASAADGDISARDVADVLEHTRVQYTETTEETWADVVDATRLATADGRAIDASTPSSDAGTVDLEDYAVLFELDRLRCVRGGGAAPPLPRRYDVLVLDEAQELAPLELRLLGRALAPDGTLVVAGDAGQQVDVTACFEDWNATMRDLGADRHHRVTLETSYRCHPTVTALARHVLDPATPAPPLDGDGPVGFVRCANECHLAARLVDGLRELVVDDPRASVAVIARTAEAAKVLAARLARGVDVRLALDGDFHFGAGVQVTAVREVKGLEFDHVVVPDASSSTYPDSGEARRALYVAITRAAHRVVLASASSWSPLLAGTGITAP